MCIRSPAGKRGHCSIRTAAAPVPVRRRLQPQHAADELLVAERRVGRDADVHGDDGDEAVRRPGVDVAEQVVEGVVVGAPVRQRHQPPESRRPSAGDGREVAAQRADEHEAVEQRVLEERPPTARAASRRPFRGTHEGEPRVEQDEHEQHHRDAEVLVQLERIGAIGEDLRRQRQRHHPPAREEEEHRRRPRSARASPARSC